MKTLALTLLAAATLLAGCASTVSSDSYCVKFEDRIEKMDGKSVAVNRCVAWGFTPSLGQRARFFDEQQRITTPAPAPADDKK
jgi:hypothetical protein